MAIGSADAEKALRKLTEGNRKFAGGEPYSGNVGVDIRHKTADGGQIPYAAVITCSDSRVIPEIIFSAGIGDLFVIRSAGNTAGIETLGSLEYAIRHLGVRLVILMGHLGCGAINAAMCGEHNGWTGRITENIAGNIVAAKDEKEACEHNVCAELEYIRHNCAHPEVLFVGAVYDIRSGRVEFFDN